MGGVRGVMRKCVAIAILAGALLTGCTTGPGDGYVRDGVAYGVTEGPFRGRWWSYYERGTSFLAGEFHAEAASDFRVALGGRSRESWRARTYGLHFTEYFPNRELGVALYHLGELEEAAERLRTSIEQLDTERARYFLDAVTRAKIAQGLIEDAAAPAIEAAVGPGQLVNVREVPLTIEATDDVGVARVTLDGEALHQRGSAMAVRFEENLLLNEGRHSLALAASDLADRAVEKTIEVTVDLTAPTIGISAPALGAVVAAAEVMVEGVAADAHGVAWVAVNGTRVAEGGGAVRTPFASAQALTPGENVIVVSAQDLAGNESRMALRVFRGAAESPAAHLWRTRELAPERLAQANAAGSLLPLMLAAAPEEAPGIYLRSPQADRDQPYRHNRTLRVVGEVVTGNEVASLRINGEPVGERTGTPRETFTRNVPIDAESGTVQVTVEAADAAGAEFREEVTAPVQPVLLRDRRLKLPLALLPIRGAGVGAEDLDGIWSIMNAALMDSGRFRMPERMELDAILTELQLSEIAEPSQALQVGRLAQSYVMVALTLIARDAGAVEAHARVIDTTSATQLTTHDVFIPDARDGAAVRRAAAGLVNYLKAYFPELSGEVTFIREARGSREVGVNWTTEDGVPELAPLWVVAEVPAVIDELTGMELYPADYQEIVRGRILGVRETGSRAEVVEISDETIPLETGLPAVTM